MAFEPGTRYVVPNPRLLSTLGTLNILFGTCLLLCALGNTVYVIVAVPQLNKAMEGIQKKVEADQEAKKKASLETLDEQEKTAKSDEEKAEITAKRKEILARKNVAFMPGLKSTKDFGFENPRLIAYVWVDFFTAFVLNVLLLASGIGLVMRKLWGLRLALGVAVAKIIRLILCYGYVAIEIVPAQAVSMSKAVVEMIQQQHQTGAGPPAAPQMYETLVRFYSIMGAVVCVGMILVGMIYPIILLWLLSRPAAKAACEVPSNVELPGGMS